MNAAATGINVQNFHIQDQEGKPPSIIPIKVLSPPPQVNLLILFSSPVLLLYQNSQEFPRFNNLSSFFVFNILSLSNSLY